METVYFMVGIVGGQAGGRFFKVFEFTKGRVYFELIDEVNLPLYQNPIHIKDEEVNMVCDSPEKVLKQLEEFKPKVKVAKDDKELLKNSLEGEIKRISEKYNIT